MGSLIAATWLMFRTQLSTVVRSKRALICLLLALGPPAISLLPPARVSAFAVTELVGMMLVLQVVAPLIGLIAGSAVLTEEIENRTITYAFTRPVHRASLFLGRYLATLAMVTALLAPSAVGVVLGSQMRQVPRVEAASEQVDEQMELAGNGALPAPHSLEAQPFGPREVPLRYAGGLVLAAVLAGALYSLLTGGLGVFVKRPMVVGLFYLVAMEGVLANIPGSAQKMTFQYYLRGISTRLGVEENQFLRGAEMIQHTEFLTPFGSSLRLVILMGLSVVICTWAIRRRQYVLTS
jgi:hypothetical protein